MSTLLENLKEQRDALLTRATEIAQRAVESGNGMSGEDSTTFDGLMADVDASDARMQSLAAAEAREADILASFRSNGDHRTPQTEGDGSFGQWARSAQIGGPGFDLTGEAGAERRAIANAREHRAMDGTAGTGKLGVYSQLWEYAVAGSQILQAGVDIITTQNGNALPLPVVTAHATGASAAANAAITASDAALTTVDLTAAKYGYLTLVPTELTQDTTFDIEGYISRAAGRELGRLISKVASTAAIAGFTVSGATAPTASVGATGSVFSDALITLFHSVQPEYRTTAAWLLADPTAASIRKTKDATGRYVWEPALTSGNPDLVLGKGTFIDPNLPSTGASKVIYFGDFSALKVRIAGGMRFERSNDYAFGNDQIAYRAIVRTGAVVVDANAVKHLALTAS